MEKKFKFWRFLGALLLPFLVFAILFALAMIIYIRLFFNFCNAPMFEEPESTFLCFGAITLFVLQLVVCLWLFFRSRNLFVRIGFIISISLTILVFHGPVKRRITYKSRMMDLSNWNVESLKDDMAAYFIKHDVYIGKTYEEVVKDLGEPRQTKIQGKYVYELPYGLFMYELFFENNKCVKQSLQCMRSDKNLYYMENF
jgi:hypothetical protein